MQVKGKQGELLKRAIQDIIETNENTENINLYTNETQWLNLTPQELKNRLLSLKYHPIKQDIKSIALRIRNNKEKQKNSIDNLFFISDFQETDSDYKLTIDSTTNYNFIQLTPSKTVNISLDSVYVSNRSSETITLKIIAKSFNTSVKNVPVSLYDENILLGKSTIDIDKNSVAEIEFKIPFKETINGKVTTANDNLNFDNNLYFTINKATNINVLAIGETNTFLEKIYTDDEHSFKNSTLNSLDYTSLSNQNLLILNELENLPNALVNSITEAVTNGSNLVIIPHKNSNLNAYNSLFKALNMGTIFAKNDSELMITDIHFQHPFFTNVFEKSIQNFQYPKVNEYYNTKLRNSSTIVSFENETPFISQIKKKNSTIYWLSSALNSENSNFKNSPLIVPIFYNFSKYSYKYSQLNYTIGHTNDIEVKATLQKDDILEIANVQESFIPMQQVGNTSVKITTDDLPTVNGIYSIKNKENTLQNIAFNYDRKESILNYINAKDVFKKASNINHYSSVKEAFIKTNNNYKTTNLWQLFLLCAIVFLVIEILLLKFFKP